MQFKKRPYGNDHGSNMRDLRFEFGGKIWVYCSSTEQKMIFKVAEHGGQKADSFLRRWLKRHDAKRSDIVKEVPIKQSYLSKIENGHRKIPQKLIDYIIRKDEELKAAEKEQAKRILQNHMKDKLKRII